MGEIGAPLHEEPIQVPDPVTEPARVEPSPQPAEPARPVPEPVPA